ncbi:MAG: hypothetical protein PHT07_08075 [Paludibacter sp.]|nr:hypothetical protein [Paludibacter sp.]
MNAQKITILILLFFCFKTEAVELPNKFEIPNCLEIQNDNTIIINYNYKGFISERSYADYYRIGKLDSIYCNVTGNFKDYYINGKIALEGCVLNNKLNGDAIYYYKNGKVKERGFYKDDVRDGIWRYFYDNGNTEKIIKFTNDVPLIGCYYTRGGESKVVNGFGEYKGSFVPGNMGRGAYIISGHCDDGKMNGKWSFFQPDTEEKLSDEYFENGMFVKGVSMGYEYKDKQKILIQGYVANENFNIYEKVNLRPSNSRGLGTSYKGSNLHYKFYPELIDDLNLSNISTVKDQWVLVHLTINKNDKLSTINIYSSKNDTIVKYKLGAILSGKSQYWKAERVNYSIMETGVVFSVIFTGGKVVIPANVMFDKEFKLYMEGSKR